MTSLYNQTIFKHFRHPKNKGALKNPTKIFVGKNPYCGDNIEVHIVLDDQEKITAIAWNGEGCAISQAAASILSERIKGKTLVEVAELQNDDFLSQFEIAFSPTRLKCALLPLYAVREQDIEDL